MIQYEVVVKRIGQVTKVVRGDYVVTGQDEAGRNVYGYAPDRENEVKVEEDVFKQKIPEDKFNLVNVIREVNGL